MRRPILRIVAALGGVLGSLAAASLAFGSGDQMGFTGYYFSDSGLNSVVTTSFNMAKKLLRQTSLLIDIELDRVYVPPVSATTGATRPQRRKGDPFEKSRGQVIVGLEQGLGRGWTVAGNFYRSQEVDYTSNAVLGTISKDFFNENATLTIRGQYNTDRVGKILESGDIFFTKRHTFTGALNITQVLSQSTVMDLSYDIVYMKGNLSDPYRQVRIIDETGGSLIVDELHPRRRWRHAGTARLTQFVPALQASLVGSYRYYGDTWNVRSHTAEVKFYKYIFKDFVFGATYRYYTQTGATFFSNSYAGSEFAGAAYRTADYKLKPFSANNVGLSMTFLLRALGGAGTGLDFLENSSVELMYFRYFNSLNFSADILQASIKFSI